SHVIAVGSWQLALAVWLENQLTKRKNFSLEPSQKAGPPPNPLHAVLGCFSVNNSTKGGIELLSWRMYQTFANCSPHTVVVNYRGHYFPITLAALYDQSGCVGLY